MREVIERFACEIDRKDAKQRRFPFFWPETGKTYVIDPCEEHWDAIHAALSAFVETGAESVAGNHLVVAPEAMALAGPKRRRSRAKAEPLPLPAGPPPQEIVPPLPEGMMWKLAANAGRSQLKYGGVGKVHATWVDKGVSRCGVADRWLGDPPPGAELCGGCVKFIGADLRKAANTKEARHG